MSPTHRARAAGRARRAGSRTPRTPITQPETRAARHHGQPPPRLTPSSLYWHFTKAPRRRLTDPNHDVIRPALVLLGLTIGAFGVAVHDIANQAVWWAPFRGLAALLGGLFLVWTVFAYLGRPPTVSKPSLVARALEKHRDRHRDTPSDDE